MTSSPDVGNMSTVISSFGDILDNCCTKSYVTYNVMCAMRSCGMLNWI